MDRTGLPHIPLDQPAPLQSSSVHNLPITNGHPNRIRIVGIPLLGLRLDLMRFLDDHHTIKDMMLQTG